MASTKKPLNSEGKFRIATIIVSLTVIVVNIFFYQLCCVSGKSMFPTLNEGNILLMDKFSKNYERMDIVVLRKNGMLLIKRVVGLPGEDIKIENNKILINGTEIEDVVECDINPGIAGETITLGEGEFFVLGDNRGNSCDSRDESVGSVNKKEIVGEVILSVIPFGKCQ